MLAEKHFWCPDSTFFWSTCTQTSWITISSYLWFFFRIISDLHRMRFLISFFTFGPNEQQGMKTRSRTFPNLYNPLDSKQPRKEKIYWKRYLESIKIGLLIYLYTSLFSPYTPSFSLFHSNFTWNAYQIKMNDRTNPPNWVKNILFLSRIWWNWTHWKSYSTHMFNGQTRHYCVDRLPKCLDCLPWATLRALCSRDESLLLISSSRWLRKSVRNYEIINWYRWGHGPWICEHGDSNFKNLIIAILIFAIEMRSVEHIITYIQHICGTHCGIHNQSFNECWNSGKKCNHFNCAIFVGTHTHTYTHMHACTLSKR